MTPPLRFVHWVFAPHPVPRRTLRVPSCQAIVSGKEAVYRSWRTRMRSRFQSMLVKRSALRHSGKHLLLFMASPRSISLIKVIPSGAHHRSAPPDCFISFSPRCGRGPAESGLPRRCRRQCRSVASSGHAQGLGTADLARHSCARCVASMSNFN